MSWRTGGLGVLFGLAVVCTACGDAANIPQAVSQSPFRTGTVAFSQTGNAPVQVQNSTVSFGKDDAGLLVVRGQLHSSASATETVDVRVSLYDSAGHLIGDATGSNINVTSGALVAFQLNGPAPSGTIAKAVFEVSVKAAP